MIPAPFANQTLVHNIVKGDKMAKKLPKGYSVKTIVEEVGFNDMYRW